MLNLHALTWVLALLFLTIPKVAKAASGCDDCPPPQVTVYDFDASALKPANTEVSNPAAIDYLELYFASGGFFGGAFNNDAKHACTQINDATFNPDLHTVKQTDAFHPSLPTPGIPAAGDYFVEGRITGAPGAYVLSALLEDSTTREQVAQSTVSFGQAGDSMKAGENAEALMAALFDKIRTFQKKKRDSSTDTAISARMTLSSAKDKIDVNETTHVDVLLKDCDGTPLKNRKLTVHGDSVASASPADVTTDDAGKARVRVTGLKKGLASLSFRYQYTSVVHKQTDANGGYLTIRVSDPLTDVWEMTLDASQDSSYSSIQQSQTYKETNQSTDHWNYHMRAWLRVEGFEPGAAEQSITSVELVSISGGGDYSTSRTTHAFNQVTDHCTWTADGSGYGQGHWTPDPIDPEAPAPATFALSLTSVPGQKGQMIFNLDAAFQSHSEDRYKKIWACPNNPEPENLDSVLDDKKPASVSEIGVVTPEMVAKNSYEFTWNKSDTSPIGLAKGVTNTSIRLKLRPLRKSDQ